MRQTDNLIQDDAKTLAGTRFFDNEAVRTAQTVVALRSVQPMHQVSEVLVQTPYVALRPAKKRSNSLAYILLSLVALGASAAAFYFLPARNQSTTAKVSQDAADDNIDDSVKPKILVSQKPTEPQANSKILSAAPPEKNKSVKQNERAAQKVPTLTPDETEPGEWVSEDAVDLEEEKPEPKTKKRRDKKADGDLESFVREVENVERQTRRIKKVLDEFGND
jgi:uncharacterized protein HemX